MSDIRKFFKAIPTSSKKRTRDQTDEEVIVVPKNESKPASKPPAKTVQKATPLAKPAEKTTPPTKPAEKITPPAKLVEKTTPPKKMKTVDLDPTEKRKRAENFQSFRNRGGPDAPGSKEIPDGEKNCLQNLTFVISGVLESLERDDCKALIEKYSGRVTSAISGKTNYLIIGRDMSEAKVNKAKELKVEIITEDDLIEMIRTRPEQGTATKKSTLPKNSSVTAKEKTKPTSMNRTTSESVHESVIPKQISDDPNLLWVDKYKPQSIKGLVGQQGDKSPVQKLIIWLRDWYSHHSRSDEKVKAKPSFGFNRNENPAMFKAALLSGPPGIGKTTAAQLVCQHLNYEYIEKNASDQRSKKSMSNLSSDTYSIAHITDAAAPMGKHVLIMDEVDGVSGNEDRGGIQELILLIKRSRIPIICICNDRQHKKIRSLANYCYDLRFSRPQIPQIRAAMMTILRQENISGVKQETLDEIIQSCNQDIRQTLHTLNLWTMQGNRNQFQAAKMIEKNVNNNPFELCRLSFSDEYRSKSLTDKTDIFFYDYQLMPLLIQENYLNCQPHLSSSSNEKRKLTDLEHLNLLSSAADSIALGDVCSQMIFSRNESWSLLPYQAIFSTVSPCSYVRGHLRGAVSFSSFFGQRSRTNKNERLLNEIEKHLCLKISSANKQQFNLDYLSYLCKALIFPLKQLPNDQGVEQCISLLNDYYLNRDDLQTMMELNTWGKNGRNPYDELNTQLKASFTRMYNKTTHRTPYAIIDMKRLKRSKGPMEDGSDNDEDEQTNISDDENPVENDAMIKVAKKRLSKPPAKKSRVK